MNQKASPAERPQVIMPVVAHDHEVLVGDDHGRGVSHSSSSEVTCA